MVPSAPVLLIFNNLSTISILRSGLADTVLWKAEANPVMPGQAGR